MLIALIFICAGCAVLAALVGSINARVVELEKKLNDTDS